MFDKIHYLCLIFVCSIYVFTLLVPKAAEVLELYQLCCLVLFIGLLSAAYSKHCSSKSFLQGKPKQNIKNHA